MDEDESSEDEVAAQNVLLTKVLFIPSSFFLTSIRFIVFLVFDKIAWTCSVFLIRLWFFFQVAASNFTARTRAVRKATTNIISLDLGTLGNDAPIFTGEIIRCKQCQAVFSHISSVADAKSSSSDPVWTCEFCSTDNEIVAEEEELKMAKQGSTIDYLIEAPPPQAKGDGEEIIVYCIDISGSMCCTSEAPPGFRLKSAGALNDLNRQFNDDHSNQRLPSERRNVTYVSRLECVQAAVNQQLSIFEKNFPNRRCVLVTFSSDVTIYDPKTKQAHVIAGDHLSDWEWLSAYKSPLNLTEVSSSIKNTRAGLSELVSGLEERGATALGPALITSVKIASAVAGSQVILCTDGLANVGVGNLEGKGDDAIAKTQKFYSDVSDLAVQSGVMVNVISIKGTHTSLENLAKICQATRGLNDIVDPLNMQENFNVMLQNPVVATDVSVKMVLHAGLKFHDGAMSEKVHNVGNATKESNLSFEFEMASKEVIDKLIAQKKDQVPFQVQISYVRKATGAKLIRVMTQAQPLTQNRDVAEENANVQVLGMHSVQESARLAQEGNYSKARMRGLAYQKLGSAAMSKKKDVSASEKKTYTAWVDQAAELDDAIVVQKKKEVSRGKRYDSADEDLSDSEGGSNEEDNDAMDMDVPVVKTKAMKKRTKQAAHIERAASRTKSRAEDEEGDTSSNVLYRAANAWSSAFK